MLIKNEWTFLYLEEKKYKKKMCRETTPLHTEIVRIIHRRLVQKKNIAVVSLIL